MKFHFLTIFPEYFDILGLGILGRAAKEGRFEVNVVNIRDFSLDKHHKTDDYPGDDPRPHRARGGGDRPRA